MSFIVDKLYLSTVKAISTMVVIITKSNGQNIMCLLTEHITTMNSLAKKRNLT